MQIVLMVLTLFARAVANYYQKAHADPLVMRIAYHGRPVRSL